MSRHPACWDLQILWSWTEPTMTLALERRLTFPRQNFFYTFLKFRRLNCKSRLVSQGQGSTTYKWRQGHDWTSTSWSCSVCLCTLSNTNSHKHKLWHSVQLRNWTATAFFYTKNIKRSQIFQLAKLFNSLFNKYTICLRDQSHKRPVLNHLKTSIFSILFCSEKAKGISVKVGTW